MRNSYIITPQKIPASVDLLAKNVLERKKLNNKLAAVAFIISAAAFWGLYYYAKYYYKDEKTIK